MFLRTSCFDFVICQMVYALAFVSNVKIECQILGKKVFSSQMGLKGINQVPLNVGKNPAPLTNPKCWLYTTTKTYRTFWGIPSGAGFFP